MNAKTDTSVVTEAGAVVERILPLLAGHGAEVQAAALALLTTEWVCRHHPAQARPGILLAHFQCIGHTVKSFTARGH